MRIISFDISCKRTTRQEAPCRGNQCERVVCPPDESSVGVWEVPIVYYIVASTSHDPRKCFGRCKNILHVRSLMKIHDISHICTLACCAIPCFVHAVFCVLHYINSHSFLFARPNVKSTYKKGQAIHKKFSWAFWAILFL